MIGRVAGTIANWGREGGYFASDADADIFEAELTATLLHQEVAFNLAGLVQRRFRGKPTSARPASSSSVEDTMDSILDWNTRRQHLPRRFRFQHQPLQHPADRWSPLKKAAPLPARSPSMRGADSWAGTIKSGGKTRRAAKMVVLDVDHPDVEHFINLARRTRKEGGRAP